MVEDMLASKLARGKHPAESVPAILEVLRILEDRSPRLIEILKFATSYEDPDTRWQTATLLEEIVTSTNAAR